MVTTPKRPAVVRRYSAEELDAVAKFRVQASAPKEACVAARAIFEARILFPEIEEELREFEMALYREADRLVTLARPAQRKGKR